MTGNVSATIVAGTPRGRGGRGAGVVYNGRRRWTRTVLEENMREWTRERLDQGRVRGLEQGRGVQTCWLN